MKRRRLHLAVVALLLAAGCTARPANTGATDPAATNGPAFARPGPDVGEPCGLAVSAASVWILGCPGWLVQVPKDGRPAVARTLAGEVLATDGLVARDDGTAVWALISRLDGPARRGTVAMIDQASGGVRSNVAVGSAVPMHAVATRGRLWLAMLDGRLLAVEGSAVRRVAAGEPLVWTAADGSHLWTVAENGDMVRRSAITGAKERTLPRLPWRTNAFTVAFGSLWAAPGDGGAVRIAPATGKPERLRIEGTVNAIERCGDVLWLSQPDAGLRSVSHTGEVVRTVPLAAAPRYLACDGERLWILAEDGRLGVLDIP